MILPLGVFLAFINAPTSGFPVAVGWCMVAISCMIWAMSGVLAAVNCLLSKLGLFTGILASRTGSYSSGIVIGVPE